MPSSDQRLDSVEDYYDIVHACREELKAGTQNCLKILEEVARIDSPRMPDFRGAFKQILDRMGTILINATKPFLEDEWKKHHLNIYFWPGYESTLIEGANKRVTLDDEVSPDGLIPCGVGYSLNGDHTDWYKAANTSVWFERALTVCSDDHGHGSFIPGSTHAWISQKSLRLKVGTGNSAVGDSATADSGSSGFLTVLDIHLSDEPDAPQIKHGILKIELNQEDPGKWAGTIAACLNDPNRVSYTDNWPTPLARLDKEKPIARDIRLNLYNIWIAASFQVPWTDAWFKAFLNYLIDKDLSCLAERLHRPIPSGLEKQPALRRWYTLRLEKSVEPSGDLQTLGSAMILSSTELPPVYLFLATTFVNEMYFRMRDIESNIKARIAGQKESQIKLLSQYKSLARKLSTSLKPALQAYQEVTRAFMPDPEDLLDLYKSPTEYIPDVDNTPFFNRRFAFQHTWTLEKIQERSRRRVGREYVEFNGTETFVTQFSCILLSYLGDGILPLRDSEWDKPVETLIMRLKERKQELRVFEEMFPSTLERVLGEQGTLQWDNRDADAFSRILKGCFHYPVKYERLTGPLLALWVLEQQGQLDDQARTWLLEKAQTAAGTGWPSLDTLKGFHTFWKDDTIQSAPCDLGIIVTLNDRGGLSKVEVKLSSCADHVLAAASDAFTNSTGDLLITQTGSLRSTVSLFKRYLNSVTEICEIDPINKDIRLGFYI